MSETTITPRDNGPYVVKGNFKVMTPDGRELPVNGDTAFLCRCGGSTNKPFCDGTHSKIGFAAAMQAVATAEGDRGDTPAVEPSSETGAT